MNGYKRKEKAYKQEREREKDGIRRKQKEIES